MEDKLPINILIREEEMEDKKVFIVNNEELGIADFGDTLDLALINFKKSLKMYLEAYPEKKKLFIEKEEAPVLMSKIFF